MNPNDIASLAEEVKSFVDESLIGIEGKIEARLAEAVELVNQINAKTELVSEHSELRNDDIDDLADALDMLTSQIAKIEAIEIKHGVDGVDGKDGSDGSDGIDGVNGEQGEAGAKGADGADGSDGAGVDVPIHKAGVYREGSVVQANLGQYFKALQDTAEGVDHESWERVGLSGFRMTGAFDESKEYLAGDLFIKDFGLFLSDGEDARLVAGRGPSGKRGEKGLAGKDGAPGVDGSDGDSFDALEISGTNLVVVVKKSDGDLETKAVDLSPLLEVTAEITKSVEVKTASDVKAQFEAHAKGLLEYISEHISDQAAVPINFYRGIYSSGNSYVRGDTVTYAGSLYVTSENTTDIPDSIFSEGDNPWRRISSAGGGGGDVDLLGYVKRPPNTLRDKWLLYRETTDGKQEWTPATTDLIETNGMLMFRDIKGRFAPTPEELDELTNQLKVNRFIWDKIQALDLRAGGVAISDTPPEEPDNGMFWFDNSEEVMQLFIWHKDSDAWIPVAPPTTLEGRVSQGEDTQKAIIAQINESLQVQADILLKVGELDIQKGSVARYKVMGTEVGAAARAGEMYVDNADAHDITFISLAPLDLQNNPTKPCHQGDIIELDWPDGGVARYEVDSGEQVALTVKYISGTHRFETGQELETYVYPQNKGSASKEYVESLVNQASPIGTIVFWGGNRVNIPTGWIECNEQKLPDNVAAILGTSYAPDLKNYMPAGIGGVFGDTRGKYAARHHKHRHMWGAPQDRKGWPSGSTDENGSSSSPSKAYWRGANTSTTSSYAEATSYSGDKDFACPPVQTGVYIMRIA